MSLQLRNEVKTIRMVAVLGSTGSIGLNTLEIVEKLGHRFKVAALAAGRNLSLLMEQVQKFRPKIVSVGRQEDAEVLRERIGDSSIRVVFGQEGTEEVAGFEENDIVVSAITGIGGLRPTMAAVRSGKKVALANKESMVVAGRLIREEASRSQAQIVPVDSEHSGIFQCLAKERREDVKEVTLTASGGPFFKTPLAEIKGKTLEEALRHPRWKMGKKVTVDSATLMNKGLELIEALWLFDLRPSQLKVLVHPQSIVHSLVEMRDGSVLAQLSPTDMKIPIQYALTFPERENSLLPSLDLRRIRTLEFFEVEEQRYPLYALACLALEDGGSLPVVLNAANEAAVSAFLRRKLEFPDIAVVVQEIVLKHRKREVESLEEIFAVDSETRAQTENLIKQRM